MSVEAVGPEALETHRVALTGHCYRMLGSPVDAEDAVQETMIRAWRGLERFDGRAALRTWMIRIATNVCLDTLAARKRRARPMEDGPAGTVDDPLLERPRSHWLEPVPDASVLPAEADPAERALLRESIRLAFVAALQHLPPKQRAALLLAEVLGFSAAEVAETLELSVASVNSALQRARATLRTRGATAEPAELTPAQRTLVARYLEAFEAYDVDALSQMLTDDATLSMPPYALWLEGPASIRAWLLGHGIGCRGSRVVPTAANGSPSFAQYRAGGPGEPHRAWALVVLELEGERVRAVNSFLDTETLFPRFGLPLELSSPPDR
ncbi:MAG: sigma-70 family RNA polymerase sigma factor [Myxococcales bacterium]|nr:sigma-70 family RNA polymerase sigma factor [Myxococcales bacterium]